MHSTKDNLEVLFEDNHLLIVNKKSGDIVTVKLIRNSVQMILEMELLE